jgi:hypothetical protein
MAAIEPRRMTSVYWLGHIPFAAELTRRLRPEIVVELGTYTGSSLAAFCQTVAENQLPTRCYGVDLWQGDIHMGDFEPSMFDEVAGYFSLEYPDTAVLVRRSFDDAAPMFTDGSIDLLNIDGTHTYEAVSHDYRTWRPKLSRRGVVLFHDTNVTRRMVGKVKARDFGVRRFYDEIKRDYPHVEFRHSYGLGVLGVGSDVPPSVMDLIRASKRLSVRRFFAERGNALIEQFGGELPPSVLEWLYRSAKRRVLEKLRALLA